MKFQIVMIWNGNRIEGGHLYDTIQDAAKARIRLYEADELNGFECIYVVEEVNTTNELF